jgi:hypothetical protein
MPRRLKKHCHIEHELKLRQALTMPIICTRNDGDRAWLEDLLHCLHSAYRCSLHHAIIENDLYHNASHKYSANFRGTGFQLCVWKSL